ncbi:MAG: hypothetical protein AB8B88_11490 [Devosiaceae bacterium]
MPAPRVDHIDWEKVRVAYEGRGQTVAKIMETYGVSSDRLYRRALKEGWAVRRRANGTPRRRPKPHKAICPGVTPTEKRAALAARLFHALEERIMTIEDDLQDHDASHGERDAKALTAMARALDMLGEMLEANDTKHATHLIDQEQEIDADEFRQVLTDRLDRLRASGGSE